MCQQARAAPAAATVTMARPCTAVLPKEVGGMHALVAYATKHGSTQQVAEAIASTLQAHGAQVEVRPAREVRGPIGDQDLVVHGAPN